jgi:hypothetical protein
VHPHSAAPSQCCTLTVLHPHSAAPSQCCTLTVLHPHSAAPSQRCTLTVLHPHSAAPSQRCTLTVLHPYAGTATTTRHTPMAGSANAPKLQLCPHQPHSSAAPLSAPVALLTRRFLSQPRKPLNFNRYFEAAHEAETLQRQQLLQQSRADTKAALAPAAAFVPPEAKRRDELRRDVRARMMGLGGAGY